MTFDNHITVVYVIAPDENGPCKIGFSNNVLTRLKTLQTGSWLPLSIYGVRVAFRRSEIVDHITLSIAADAGAKRVEHVCHRELKECGVHLCGEWFDITAEEALQAIKVAARKNECGALGLDDLTTLDVPETDALMKATYNQLFSQLLEVNRLLARGLDESEMGA